jgi:putative DNA primase/helicase
VVILCAEDSIRHTVKPRVMAAGGDPSKVYVLSAAAGENDMPSPLTLQKDVATLETVIAEIGDVVLVIIDPLSSYMGKVDSHANADVRSVVEPLHLMAERTGVAVITNGHFSKAAATSKSRASHRILGSTAFIALPRTAFAVVEDPDDEGRRLFLPLKSNLGPLPQGLAFRPEVRIAGYARNRCQVNAVCATWEDAPVVTTADEAIAQHEARLRGERSEASDGPRSERQAEAERVVRELLAGGEISAKEGRRLALEAGITPDVLRAVRERIVDTVKEHDAGGRILGWAWRLKSAPATSGGSQ